MIPKGREVPGVAERQPTLDSMKAQDDCRRIFAIAALAERFIESSHEVRLVPGVDILSHQFVKRLSHRIHVTPVAAHIGQSHAGEQVEITDGKIVKVAPLLLPRPWEQKLPKRPDLAALPYE